MGTVGHVGLCLIEGNLVGLDVFCNMRNLLIVMQNCQLPSPEALPSPCKGMTTDQHGVANIFMLSTSILASFAACVCNLCLLAISNTGAGVSVPAPPPSEAPTSPTMLKSLSSKLMRSMKRSSDLKEPLSTQMSNLSPHRQQGESPGATIPCSFLQWTGWCFTEQ